ncbi:hypothetical protein MGYG_05505 [Nannizzia gypsea CBS 118893]|uniref:Uncharacterized protein n=1 Tax=Arthroderma gypseum (strain ATCC MYA-4604 / CBS 118893) TaxID=535722 RepID=E4UWB5_ARTGP|nr:hypothetical protein MGYG_05505 [Nannizzia gypsea CBS 118893]EFR02510.1 hypothetical protein MGYG_05505 [Nannizzia gypsea CBS 118893]
MAQKDMRRADLVVPYEAPPVKKTDGDMSGTIASTMPMAAACLTQSAIFCTKHCVNGESTLIEATN